MRKRREFSARTKDQAAERADGHCEVCTAELSDGNIDYDHIIPDDLGGEPTLENCQVVCKTCHRSKTRGDVKVIAKGRRIRRKRRGIRKRSSFRGWRKFNDDVVINKRRA